MSTTISAHTFGRIVAVGVAVVLTAALGPTAAFVLVGVYITLEYRRRQKALRGAL